MEIEHQCPQCGAPVLLDEADRLFTCGFCRVRLFLSSQDYFRYYLQPSKSSGSEIIFAPYWRFRGMVFSCKDYDIDQRIVDTTFRAISYDWMPTSLGLRAQALPLRFAHYTEKDKWFSVTLSSRDFLSRLEKNELFNNLRSIEDAQGFYSASIGDVVSLIYAPFFIKNNTLWDGILNEPTGITLDDTSTKNLSFEKKKSWDISFLSTLCPNCGWDLIAEKESCILACTHCHSLWEPSSIALRRLEFGIVTEKVMDQNTLFVPFWRMKVHIDGVTLNSYADLVRFSNLPKIIQPQWEEMHIYFWCPAFKVHPALFLRLARQLTIFQVDDVHDIYIPSYPLYPITLPLSEAQESVMIILAHIATKKKDFFPQLTQIHIQVQESRIVYLPFKSTNNDLINSRFNCSIQKNALRSGKNI